MENSFISLEKQGGDTWIFTKYLRSANAKKILDGKILNAHISPDGKKISYVKTDDSDQKVFYLADIDGSNSVEILKSQDIDAANMAMGPWHPDGTKLLIEINKNIDPKGFQGSVIATLDVSDKDLSALKTACRRFMMRCGSHF